MGIASIYGKKMFGGGFMLGADDSFSEGENLLLESKRQQQILDDLNKEICFRESQVLVKRTKSEEMKIRIGIASQFYSKFQSEYDLESFQVNHSDEFEDLTWGDIWKWCVTFAWGIKEEFNGLISKIYDITKAKKIPLALVDMNSSIEELSTRIKLYALSFDWNSYSKICRWCENAVSLLRKSKQEIIALYEEYKKKFASYSCAEFENSINDISRLIIENQENVSSLKNPLLEDSQNIDGKAIFSELRESLNG